MENVIVSLLVAGFTSIGGLLIYMIRRIVNQVDTNRIDIAKLDVEVAVIKERVDNHEAAHMAAGYRLDRGKGG